MNIFEQVSRKALLKLDAETAHGLGIKALKTGLMPTCASKDDPSLQVTAAGLTFPNPLGIAAGFDKNAEVPDALLKRGMGFAEVGTITPKPQEGNPKPRIFRLPDQMGVINRLGFNNEGHAAALERLMARKHKGGIVGINIGANKTATDFVADYVEGIKTFAPLADYFTANISSPNTPGLRDLQAAEALEALLKAVLAARNEAVGERNVPVFLKIAPDITPVQMSEIADVARTTGVDGLIVSNTTIARDMVSESRTAKEQGGLSGKPLFESSTRVLAKMRSLVGADMPIIGVGGITDGKTALAKIEAGATLIQVYSGLIYRGFDLIDEIKAELTREVKAQGKASVAELTGRKVGDWV